MTPDAKKIQTIRATIKQEEQRLLARFPLLKYQDAIGLLVFSVSIFGILGSIAAYANQLLPAWATVISVALWTSLLHEIEHDLIHFMYFKKTPLIHNLMMAGVWLFRPNIINPWVRRKIHLHHHKVSGTQDDTEERIIGNGMKYGLVRWMIMFDPSLAGTLFSHKMKELRTFSVRWVHHVGGFPLGIMFYVTWGVFLGYHSANLVLPLMGLSFLIPEWLSTHIMPAINFMTVVCILPNLLRQAILNFVTTNMHYFGDVDGLMKQTQVINHWSFLPLHLFCFNFGSTHSIHHFVVSQPFYMRELVKRRAHQVMRKEGVRFNDFGTFKRANRFDENKEDRAV